MKLPIQVKTRHKIRDLAIIKRYSEGCTQESIAESFGITRTRVGQILYANLHLLEVNKNYEKIKRINSLNRLQTKLEGTVNRNRDQFDVIDQLRKETEGDAKLNVNVPLQLIVKIDRSTSGEIGDNVSFTRQTTPSIQ